MIYNDIYIFIIISILMTNVEKVTTLIIYRWVIIQLKTNKFDENTEHQKL